MVILERLLDYLSCNFRLTSPPPLVRHFNFNLNPNSQPANSPDSLCFYRQTNKVGKEFLFPSNFDEVWYYWTTGGALGEFEYWDQEQIVTKERDWLDKHVPGDQCWHNDWDNTTVLLCHQNTQSQVTDSTQHPATLEIVSISMSGSLLSPPARTGLEDWWMSINTKFH